MKNIVRLCLGIILGTLNSVNAQQKEDYQVANIAFYNLENLYDIFDDPLIFDDDRTPTGKDRWTEEVYQKKLNNMAFAISRIGQEHTGGPPDILGVCEVENLQVLEDLVKTPLLAPYGYDIIHYDSPDRRGIDVALLYRKKIFSPQNSTKHELVLYDPKVPDNRIYTRDQLVVSGNLGGEPIHLLVNHWPSRSGGEKLSSHKRENAARLNLKITDSLQRIDPYARIIIMGDFNDDPQNKSLRKVLGAKSKKDQVGLKDFYNPYAGMAKTGAGSLAYRDKWNLFDQILVSKSLIEKDPTKFTFFRAYIFNEPFLVTPSGQYKGYPFRSFGSTGFTDGYSDHFPVYILLVRKND
ncbi:endonuclease/exonuclease/phosphatase family protein [Salinimicrobium xinjiangense]|uniref:endonuclease/exonuclease/phosphatase family protein n=1 Tax=Salinimicrobium xinjiangense TaxID=438596 RepID=UPI0009FF4CFF|nr:endonuclease/exonuclease/phosphatase family protein [Salinimicrobium xinjiangense]